MGRLFVLLVTAFIGTASVVSTAQAKPGKVEVSILVVEAYKAGGKFDPKLKSFKTELRQIKENYKSAKVLDVLRRTVDKGTKVSLQLPKKEYGFVTIEVVGIQGSDVNLKISVPSLGLRPVVTKHVKSGTLMIGKNTKVKGTALYLAITPKIKK